MSILPTGPKQITLTLSQFWAFSTMGFDIGTKFPALFLCLAMSQISSAAIANDLNAIELANYADELLTPEAARAVQELIAGEVELKLKNDGSRSIATLYLADEFYDDLGVGSFVGNPTVIWNGNSDGRPIFFYPGGDFAYVTSEGRRIEPLAMDTDGGSVPKVLHSIGSFDPWTYGPAFIIHDWTALAYKCDYSPDKNIGIEDAAIVMAEAIKTLTETGYTTVDGTVDRLPKREDTLYLMYLAVKSSVAEKLWETKANATCR